MSAYGTVTRSAPAGRRPPGPRPSLQIHLFMKKLSVGRSGSVPSHNYIPPYAPARTKLLSYGTAPKQASEPKLLSKS